MNTYKRHRFPSDVISYAVWLYYKFNLSHRDIEDLLAERRMGEMLRDQEMNKGGESFVKVGSSF